MKDKKEDAEDDKDEEATQQGRVMEAAQPPALAAVLTPPLSLEGGLAAEHRPPNLLQCVLSLFRNVRPGSDLTHFQLPPLFNMPKSQLQCYGEMIYCFGEDYLSKCARGRNSLDRFVAVVAWCISTARPAIFGQAPFNPILGETHHVSRGSLNLLVEQVSHHPPVTAVHGTDAENDIELIWCQQPVPKFHGTGVEAVIRGKRQLTLRRFGEKYEMDSPSLFIRFLPAGADWSGNVRIRCEESALEADVCFHRGHSFLGLGGSSRCVRGNIYRSGSLDPVYEINGQWDRTVSLKDVNSGAISVLYDAKKAILKLSAPVVKDPKTPSKDVVTLSSGSDSSAGSSPTRSVQTSHEKPRNKNKASSSADVEEDGALIASKKPKNRELETDQTLSQDVYDEDERDPNEEDLRDKPAGPPVTSRLPLVFPDKVQRSKALVECVGDSIDLSGDVGAVGRIVISNGDSGNHEMLLDLKGTIYKSRIVPSRTFCIVNIGQSEAKVEAIMNDFIQLEPQSNVFEAETMVEGDLDGFTFDSEDELDKLPKPSSLQSDQNNENEDHKNSKTKGKDTMQKKAKPTSRAAKKGTRKPPVSRKGKKSKK